MEVQTENHEPAPDERVDRPAGSQTYLFTVRLWKQELADAQEYRGSVREVASGAFRNFRTWADLTSFMIERME